MEATNVVIIMASIVAFVATAVSSADLAFAASLHYDARLGDRRYRHHLLWKAGVWDLGLAFLLLVSGHPVDAVLIGLAGLGMFALFVFRIPILRLVPVPPGDGAAESPADGG